MGHILPSFSISFRTVLFLFFFLNGMNAVHKVVSVSAKKSGNGKSQSFPIQNKYQLNSMTHLPCNKIIDPAW